MRFTAVFLAFLALILSSCKPPSQGTEFEDEQNPFFRAAAKYSADRNYHAAVAEYEKALIANPNVAKAHFEMGLLYGDKLGDHVSAIYHLQKYQGLRPNAPNQDQVKTLIEKSKVDFLLTLPNSGMQNADEVARISRENSDLKQSLARAQAELSQVQKDLSEARTAAAAATAAASAPAPAPSEPAAPGIPAPQGSSDSTAATPAPATAEADPVPAPAPEPAEAQPRSYTVKSGDSLWKISASFYPKDIKGGITRIQDANPILNKGTALKPGQTLVIP